MSNEEIVARIQAGEKDLCGMLWEQVERLVAWKASREIRELEGYGGVEFGDLYNSCYPAMLEAIETYNPTIAAFSTWFMYYIKKAFYEALTEIPADQSEVIQRRFFEQKTLVKVGEAMGMTADEVRGLECKGLRAMRQPRIAKKLRPLYEDFDFYSGSGLGAFRSSGMSIQERYLIRMERREQQKKPEA